MKKKSRFQTILKDVAISRWVEIYSSRLPCLSSYPMSTILSHWTPWKSTASGARLPGHLSLSLHVPPDSATPYQTWDALFTTNACGVDCHSQVVLYVALGICVSSKLWINVIKIFLQFAFVLEATECNIFGFKYSLL